MSEMVTFRDAVVDGVKKHLGRHVTVEAHGGRFTPAELRRYATRAPAVLVAVMALPEVLDDLAPPVVTMQLAAFVITRNAPAVSRDIQALTLSESLTRIVSRNRWGLEAARAPQRLSGENLYSGEIDKLGVAMWALSWRQDLRLAAERDPGDLADFALYTATHQVGAGPDTNTRVALPTDSDAQDQQE